MSIMRISITCLTLLVCMINTNLVLSRTDSDFSRFDIFQASNLNGYKYRDDYRMMNDILIRGTESVEPKDNFDVLLDKLINHTKVPQRANLNVRPKAINLFLALTTINPENQCSPYSVGILTHNDNALNNRLRSVKPGYVLKRTEKIVAVFLKKHAQDCQILYIGRFNGKIADFDRNKLKQVEEFLDNAIKHYTTELQETLNPEFTKTYAHRLYNIVDGNVNTNRAINPNYVYQNLKIVAKDDSEAEYLQPIENEMEGNYSLHPEKYAQLFRKYVSEPCSHYTKMLGPTVFDLINFDSLFYHNIQERMVDFYEAWVRYNLCLTIGLNDELVSETITAVNRKAVKSEEKVAD